MEIMDPKQLKNKIRETCDNDSISVLINIRLHYCWVDMSLKQKRVSQNKLMNGNGTNV